VFNLSPEKILVIAIFALVVLGPNRLPQAARTLGRLLAEARRVSGSFQEEVRGALAEPHDVLNKAVGDLGVPRVSDLRSSLRSTVTDAVSPARTTQPESPASPGTSQGPPATGAQPDAVPDDPSLN
jgi:sec-independent protein translocase protein TatB